MNNLIGNEIGAMHLIASILALIFGTIVLIKKKGTLSHKIIGYLYFTNMVILLVTAFLIYRLYGKFGIFHYSALASSITLLMGMFPIWIKKPRKKWLIYHLSFMYWSVIGLYIAFIAEILTRIPNSNFMFMVYASFIVITAMGALFFKSYVNKYDYK